MHRYRDLLFVLIGIVLAAAGALLYTRAYHRAYPYGPRPASLPIVVNALRIYASDHGQSFPDINGDPYKSLEVLFPDYLSSWYLAGLSGDPQKTKLALEHGGHLSSENCSLVYFPGLFATDDQRLAIVWENRTGIAFNGRSRPGRSVGFLSGEVKQVSDDEWSMFLAQQTLMRETAIRSRALPSRTREGVRTSNLQ
jgi:hypothetical protein